MDISQLNLHTMKMVMFSSFNFSWKLSSRLKLKEENITIFIESYIIYILITDNY